MLRECIRFEALAKIVFHSPQLSTLQVRRGHHLRYRVRRLRNIFKDLLTRHKMLAADFLEANYDQVWTVWKLLHSDNYVTRRQSKTAGVLDRHNFSVMTKNISNPDNLKLMMNMLKEKSRNIQFEAFTVFKVFVANPNKPKPILDIQRNQDKLVDSCPNSTRIVRGRAVQWREGVPHQTDQGTKPSRLRLFEDVETSTLEMIVDGGVRWPKISWRWKIIGHSERLS